MTIPSTLNKKDTISNNIAVRTFPPLDINVITKGVQHDLMSAITPFIAAYKRFPAFYQLQIARARIFPKQPDKFLRTTEKLATKILAVNFPEDKNDGYNPEAVLHPTSRYVLPLIRGYKELFSGQVKYFPFSKELLNEYLRPLKKKYRLGPEEVDLLVENLKIPEGTAIPMNLLFITLDNTVKNATREIRKRIEKDEDIDKNIKLNLYIEDNHFKITIHSDTEIHESIIDQERRSKESRIQISEGASTSGGGEGTRLCRNILRHIGGNYELLTAGHHNDGVTFEISIPL